MSAVIEVLQYTLKPGTGATFHTIMETQSVPFHQQAGVKVLRFGNSPHNTDCYYLVRSFQSVSEMDNQLKQFYDDQRWKKGPRAAIISMICESHRIVIPNCSCLYL
jgi:hypothetical protein